jgi:hypothetical protein
MEEFRKDLLAFIHGVALAEREACAKIADRNASPTGKQIANAIRARPPIQLPPIAFEVKQKGRKR